LSLGVVGLLTSLALLISQERISLAGTEVRTQSSGSAKSKSPGKSHPTDQEIADAKQRNLVWVNTATRVYHKSVSPLYGTTEHGRFIREEDAKQAGYRSADESRSQRAPKGETTDERSSGTNLSGLVPASES